MKNIDYTTLIEKYENDALTGSEFVALYEVCAITIGQKKMTNIARKRCIENIKSVGHSEMIFQPKTYLTRTKMKPLDLAWSYIRYTIEDKKENLICELKHC
jgi:hypothetical protein